MNGKKIGGYITLGLVAIIFVLAFFVLRPIFMSIVAGLILTYIFYPVYLKVFSIIKERNISAFIICLLLFLFILVPTWFLMPILARQLFEVYLFLQNANFAEILKGIFSASPGLSADFYASANNFLNKFATSLLTRSTSFILNLPTLLFHIMTIFLVLFFALRDGNELRDYVKSLSHLSPETEDILYKKFKYLTNSILFGQVIVGIVQGLVTGLGFLIFGVPNTLTLTIVTIFVGILPIIGPWLVWIPVDIFLFIDGRTGSAIGLLIYSLAIISWIDVPIRPLLLSKKAEINSGIVLLGMIGGLFVFGVLGLVLGPLILAYFLLILDFYRTKKL
jgi:predicted PurR-regulated permease PerM